MRARAQARADANARARAMHGRRATRTALNNAARLLRQAIDAPHNSVVDDILIPGEHLNYQCTEGREPQEAYA